MLEEYQNLTYLLLAVWSAAKKKQTNKPNQTKKQNKQSKAKQSKAKQSKTKKHTPTH